MLLISRIENTCKYPYLDMTRHKQIRHYSSVSLLKIAECNKICATEPRRKKGRCVYVFKNWRKKLSFWRKKMFLKKLSFFHVYVFKRTK